jgi:hypothetical protein
MVLPFEAVVAPLALSALRHVLLSLGPQLLLLEKAAASVEFLDIDGQALSVGTLHLRAV